MFDFVYPVAAQVIGVSEHLWIAAFHVERPWHFHGGVAPCGDGLRVCPHAERNEWHVERHGAPFDLVGAHIFEPAFEEAMYVVQVGGGRREQADVAGPAHTFVALRAVGGDGDEVGAH